MKQYVKATVRSDLVHKSDLYQVPRAEVQVQISITPDQVQPKYWSTDSGW